MLHRVRKRSVIVAVGLPVLASIMMVVMTGPAAASWVSPWSTVRNNWAPCSGPNPTYFSNVTASPGEFEGESMDQSDGSVFCSSNTAETEINAGFDQSPTFTPATQGSHTITAVFSGSIYVYADQIGCGLGTARGTFELGTGAYDANTGKTLSYYAYPSGLAFSQTCGMADSVVTLSSSTGSISYTGVFNANQVYEPFGSIDWLTDSSEGQTGTSATALIGFGAACYQGTGNTCAGPVYLSSITIT